MIPAAAPDLVPRSRNLVIRVFAHGISMIFHPLFLPLYIAAFLLFEHPLLFAGTSTGAKARLLGTVFVNLTMLPGITVFLCWRLKFIDSLYMRTQQERIIPLAATMIFYFWGWFVLRNFATIPELFRQFLLGCFLTVIAGWLANIYFKISLHGLAAGGLLGFICVLIFGYEGGSAAYLAVALVIAGLVGTSRILLSSHHPVEVYAGILAGMLCQVIAAWL